MALTNIFYFVPEDNETPEQMNFFKVHKSLAEVRLNDIKQCFPIPGDYHFRFQFKYQGQLVWLDLSNDQVALP